MEIKKYKRKKLSPAQTIVLSFLGVIAVGTFLLMLPISSSGGNYTGLVDALFTATSAVCVTGLVVVDTGTYWSLFGRTIILLLIQIGGIGFMTLTTSAAIFLGKKIGLKNRLLMQQALNQFSLAGIIKLTKYIFLFTIGIEFIGAFILSFRFVPEMGFKKGVYYSIFHSISAFCNAGFDLMGNGKGLTAYATDPVISLTMIMLIFLGGLGFFVLVDLLKTRHYHKMSIHTRLVLLVTGILVVSGTLLMFVFEFNNPETMGNFNFFDKAVSALFLAVTPRTAGFNTLSTESLSMASKILTITFMFIGGSPGSTAGGVKTTTFGMMALAIVSVVRGEQDITLFNRRVSRQVVNKGLAVLFISVMILISTILMLSVVEKTFTFEEIVFEAFSAFGTVGLTLGITTELSVIGKMLLTLLMFFGRLGPLTIVLAISAKGNNKPLIRYPEGHIIVG